MTEKSKFARCLISTRYGRDAQTTPVHPTKLMREQIREKMSEEQLLSWGNGFKPLCFFSGPT
jgi:hypothetical protein